MAKIGMLVAARRLEKKWTAALMTEKGLANADSGKDLDQLIQEMLLGAFIDRPVGTMVSVEVVVQLPETEEERKAREAAEEKASGPQAPTK